jgi:hypothetical protein
MHRTMARKEELDMFNLERLSAVVLGTGLVVVACAAPTDAELTAPAQEADESALVTNDEPEGDDVAENGSDPNQAEDETSADVQGEDETFGEAQRRRCDRRNNWHCKRGHPGWRWVRRHYDSHRRRCCVRVRRPHW